VVVTILTDQFKTTITKLEDGNGKLISDQGSSDSPKATIYFTGSPNGMQRKYNIY
jgi:hypothetical protein